MLTIEKNVITSEDVIDWEETTGVKAPEWKVVCDGELIGWLDIVDGQPRVYSK